MKNKNLKVLALVAFCFAIFTAMPVAAQKVQSWAIGTFTARNPQTGGTITLTIDRNGSVTANLDGAINYGSYDDERMTINGITSRVRKTNDGIRTTRNDNGERIDYVRGNGNIGGGGNGDVPNWAVGTFSAPNPQSGGTIILKIQNDGSVIANIDGNVNVGSYNNERIVINGISSEVRKTRNGLSTTRRDNGERIDYTRGNSNGGGNGSVGGNVPSWAVGTFYAYNPQNGGTITMTIQTNGNVAVDFGGNVTYGTVYDDQLTINGITSKLKKISNGIRTTRNDNGERIDYRRR